MAQATSDILRIGRWQASYLRLGGSPGIGTKIIVPREYAQLREDHLRRVATTLIERREGLEDAINHAIQLAAELDTLNAANASLTDRLPVCESLIAAIEFIWRPYGASMWRACVEDVLYARDERVIADAIGIVRFIERGLRIDNLAKIIIERTGLH